MTKTYTIYTRDSSYRLLSEEAGLGDEQVARYLDEVRWTTCYRNAMRYAVRTSEVIAFCEDNQNVAF